MWRSVTLSLFLVALATCDPVARCPAAVKGFQGGYVADDRNSSVFYKCFDGQAYQSFCGQGLYFDSSRDSCVTANYGNRPVYSLPSQPVSSPQYEFPDLDQGRPPAPVPSPEFEDADPDQGRALYPISGKGRCLGTCSTDYPHLPVKHLPHESDCTLFCKCDHGKPVLFFCPDGLYFNRILEVCDWPSHSRCRNREPLSKREYNRLPEGAHTVRR